MHVKLIRSANPRGVEMKRDEQTPVLSAIFVDYDNIYMSLKRKSDEAAKRFAKLSQDWLKGIETGSLITATNGVLGTAKRRIVMNRCYGNPVPRRNGHDNSTDMNSFPFIRHHFLRAGCEVVDCPPLTAQLKNSSDIRMVMDVRDYLTHDTYFDEFIILSGDADFTPVLQRLRQHARRTVIYCNEYTAQPYTAICDGEVREADLIALLLAQEPAAALPGITPAIESAPARKLPAAPSVPDLRHEIIAEVIASVRAAPAPVPLEALADRALRVLGHEKTVNTSWAGAGSFRELLRQSLPAEIQLTEQPPYFAYDPKRHPGAGQRMIPAEPQFLPPPIPQGRSGQSAAAAAPPKAPAYAEMPAPGPVLPRAPAATRSPAETAILSPQPEHRTPVHVPAQQPPATRVQAREAMPASQPSAMQQSIARIYEACQAPPLAPAEYRAVFEVLAEEINDKGLAGTQTLSNVVARAQERGFELGRDDARFILEVVSETDPWFDQGASATLFGGRFRNFVVGRCRSHGLNLSAEELDLIDSWFAGSTPLQPARQAPAAAQHPAPAQPDPRGPARWWSQSGQSSPQSNQRADALAETATASDAAGDDFPRIVRTRRS